MARFFKRQVLASNALLHHLLPARHDSDIMRSLRNSKPTLSLNQSPHK